MMVSLHQLMLSKSWCLNVLCVPVMAIEWWQTSMFGVPAVMAKAIRDSSPPPSPSIEIDHNASIMAEGTTRHSCIWRVVCEKFYIKCEIIGCITLTFMQPSGHLKVTWEFQRHVVACSEAQFNIKKILSLLTHVVKVVVTLDVCCFRSDGRGQYIKRRLSISTRPSHEWSRYFNVFVSAVGHDGCSPLPWMFDVSAVMA